MNQIILEDMDEVYHRNPKLWEELNHKTVLITGAYGMLASYMVYLLIYLNEYQGYEVKILANGRNEGKMKERFGPYIHKEYFRVLLGDIVTPFVIEEPIDYIIHAASMASSQYYKTNPADVIAANVLGTYHTLELARKTSCKGYLFFSSGEVYGKLERESIMESDMGILDPADLRSCYGEGKRAAETMCVSWYGQYGVPVNMVRPCHTYGPTMDLCNDRRVFAEFVKNVVNKENIVMKSDGSAVRIFCYIADALYAYYLVLLKGKRGEAYNVSNENGLTSIGDLAKKVCGLFPEYGLRVIRDVPSENYSENAHKKHSNYNVDKLRKLGWNAKYSIEEGFYRTICSFLKEVG
ncbi:MAG: NAD-dependent epimerase/dehydratase family protein [Lachnospiraceae bacterium]